MAHLLVLAHLLAAGVALGAQIHHLIYLRHALAGRGPWAPVARFATLVAIFAVAATVLGGLLYPTYKLVVRIPYLDAQLPGMARLFDIKEHLVALALPLLLGNAWLARDRAVLDQPAGRLLYQGLAWLGVILTWTGAVIGVWVGAVQGYRP